MDQAFSNQKHHIKFQEPIAFLLTIALIGQITFIAYAFTNVQGDITAPPSALTLIMYILNVTSITLLILYVVKLYKKAKAAILVSIFFALQALSSFLSIILCYIYYIVEYEMIEVFISSATINLIFVISFVLATICALKGLYNKAFIIIPLFLLLAYQLQTIYTFFAYSYELYVDRDMYLLIIESLAVYISQLALLTASLLFGAKNRITCIIPISKQKWNERLKKIAPQKALKFLNDELYFGTITDEEYREKRSEIILNI